MTSQVFSSVFNSICVASNWLSPSFRKCCEVLGCECGSLSLYVLARWRGGWTKDAVLSDEWELRSNMAAAGEFTVKCFHSHWLSTPSISLLFSLIAPSPFFPPSFTLSSPTSPSNYPSLPLSQSLPLSLSAYLSPPLPLSLHPSLALWVYR